MRLAAPRQQFVFDMSGCAIGRSNAAEFSHLHSGSLCVAKLSLDRNTQDSYHYLYSVKMMEVLENQEGWCIGAGHRGRKLAMTNVQITTVKTARSSFSADGRSNKNNKTDQKGRRTCHAR
jgi:hypothetical protein